MRTAGNRPLGLWIWSSAAWHGSRNSRMFAFGGWGLRLLAYHGDVACVASRISTWGLPKGMWPALDGTD
eukprot:4077975-Prorocentrum_lima.AAC.1